MNPQMQAAAGALLGQGLGNNAANVAINASAAMPAGAVSAFDRPKSVVVMGPNPLPVTIIAAPGMAAQQVKAPPPRDPATSGGGPSGPNPLARVASMLAGQFTSLLSPLQRLSTYLSPTVSGFGVFQGALRVFAATVGAMLSPILLTLAVGLLEMSDVIWEKVKPALGDFFRFMLETAMPAVVEFARAVRDAANWIARNAKEVSGGGANRIAQSAAKGMEGRIEWVKALGRAMEPGPGEGTYHFADLQPGGVQSGPAAGGKPPPRSKAMDDVLREFQMSLSPKASYQGLGTVGRSVQQASLNFTPFEQRVLKLGQDVLKALHDANRAANAPAPTFKGAK